MGKANQSPPTGTNPRLKKKRRLQLELRCMSQSLFSRQPKTCTVQTLKFGCTCSDNVVPAALGWSPATANSSHKFPIIWTSSGKESAYNQELPVLLSRAPSFPPGQRWTGSELILYLVWRHVVFLKKCFLALWISYQSLCRRLVGLS